MKTLIVARTRMGIDTRCIGGLCLDNFRSIRLLTPQGGNWGSNSDFQVGQIWDLRFSDARELRAPHLEDVFVSKWTYDSRCDTASFLEDHIELLKADTRYWEGMPTNLFGGTLQMTRWNSCYIDETNVPTVSTGFWKPDRDLKLTSGKDGRLRYGYQPHIIPGRFTFSYVGEQEPIDIIPAGTLCRVSLARWWKRENDTSEKCWLQLSEYYLPRNGA